MKIPFNRPALVGTEEAFVIDALHSSKLSGDGVYGRKCQNYFNDLFGCKTLLTPSCTHSLEMAALLINIRTGDEVIMPSFTFVSTANAFVLRGARIVFVDVRPDTMNINEHLIESAITPRTKAIVLVHYAGVACAMETIMEIADRHNIFVIEDAAQGILAEYKGEALGTIGHIGAYSFHETKNLTSGGEGGLIIIRDPQFQSRAEIIREKGTNRSQFFRGQIDKYSWMDLGSSYLPSELQAAYLWAQIESAQQIAASRLSAWARYHNGLVELESRGDVNRPFIPADCKHNAHIYYLKVGSPEIRARLINYLNEKDVQTAFHYVPLHSAPAGLAFGRFHGDDAFTTTESERLLRLPLYFGITEQETDRVVSSIYSFFSSQN